MAEAAETGSRPPFRLPFSRHTLAAMAIGVAVLVAARGYDQNLFHTLTAVFSIVAGAVIFTIAATTTRISKSDVLSLLGNAYVWVAALNLLPILASGEFGFPSIKDGNLSAQISIAARSIEAFALVSAASVYAAPRLARQALFAAGAAAILAAGAIALDVFPPCTVEGLGPTAFKIAASCVIAAVYAVAAVRIARARHFLGREATALLVLAAAGMAVTEFILAFHRDAFGLGGIAHIARAIALLFVVIAVARASRQAPYRELSAAREELSHLFDATPVALLAVDSANRVVRANARAVTTCAHPDDALRRGTGDFLGCIHALASPSGCGFGPNCAQCAVRLQILDTASTGNEHRQIEHTLVANRRGVPTSLHLLISSVRIPASDNRVLVAIEDVSHLKGIEEKLRENAAQLKGFIAAAPFGICMKDTAGRFLFANEVVCRRLGTTPAAILGRTVGDFRPDDEAIEVGRREALATERKAVDIFEGWVHPRFGPTLFVRDTRFPILDEDGTAWGIGVISEDVTAQKIAENALRESEDRYSALVKSAPIGIAVCRQGRIVFLNEEAVRICGARDHADLMGKDIVELVSGNERERFATAMDAWFAGTAQGAIEIRHRRFDRQEIDAWVCGRAVTYAGEPALQLIVRDITEEIRTRGALAESEARMEALLEASPAGIFLKDLSRRFIVANKALSSFHDLQPADVVGRRAEDFMLPEVAASSRQEDLLVIHEKRPVLVEWSRPLRDGTMRHFTHIKFPILDKSGNLTGLGGMAFDVTDRKVYEIQLLEAKRQAEAANHAKSEFLANMSHELRTPLNSILGFSEIMFEEVFGSLGAPRYVEYARDIHESGKLLLRIIDDILDLSRIELAGVQLDEDVVDLKSILESVLRLLRVRAQAREVRIETEVSPDLPRLRADSLRVKQILLNLGSNAVKFTPRGGRVDITFATDEWGAIVVSVSDTGIGMTPDDIGIALQPFGQVASAQNRASQGTGLGLPIAKSLTELHGGTLEIESKSGAGTTVTVRFPKARSVAD